MISSRAENIPSFLVMDILEAAQELERAGEDIVHLEIGEPDFGAPEYVVEAAARALREGKTRYTHCQGIIELREAICDHYFKNYNVAINPDRVFVNSGSSPAMFSVFGVLLDPGDEVILTNPHYACYPSIFSFLGGRPMYLNLRGEEGFRYRVEDVKGLLTPKTKAILINSPANPTGIVIKKEDLETLARGEHGFIISDEIYHGLVYEGQAHSILEFTDRAFVLNGFSKVYGMTGWRLGYTIVPQEFIRPMQKVQQNFFISANAFVQWAGVAALTGPQDHIGQHVTEYDKRRRFLIQRLREIGFGIGSEPTGAFYVLADAHRFGSDSHKLAFELLGRAKVGATPGIDFGSKAEGFLRFSYSNALDNIAEGMDRLERYLQG
ncbi:MAG: pyridoxal phosphate-dependent aminotransferase [Gemmatimonadota bacterium]|nr:MAG: pyridoxal phosphate-dependent aminotransferase [Gemmatimonadota bacterium]